MILFIHEIAKSMSFFFLPLFLLELGFNGFQSGLTIGIFTLVGLLFSFHIGMKCDCIKNKNIFIFGIILFSLFSFGASFFSNFWIIFMLFFLGGLGHLSILRTAESSIYKSTKKKNKGKQLMWLRIVREAPFAIGILIGGFIIHNYGLRGMFIVSGILTLILIFFLRNIKEDYLYKSGVSDYLTDLKNKRIIYFSLIIFVFALHFGAEQVAYSPFIKNNLGIDIAGTSYFMAFVILFLLLGSFLTSRWIDKGISPIKIMSYAMLLSGIGGIIFAATNSIPISLVGRIIHEIGDGAFLITMSFGIVSFFKKERIGGSSGFIHVVIILSSFTGSLIFGQIGYSFGYHLPHIISGIMSIIAFAMILMFRRIVIKTKSDS